jgi:hypothetical protein
VVTHDVHRSGRAYSLIFKGIDYRADIWLNGHKVANRATVVGMYDSFEFNVTQFIIPGGQNVLAVKVTPEQSLEGENGVELADSWLDWINWKYLGYHNPERHLDISFVPDRNAGIWKRGVSEQQRRSDHSESTRGDRSAAARDQPGFADGLLRSKQQHVQARVGHAV